MGGVCCKSEPIDFTQDVELKHFDLQTAIGKGAFGKVKLVQHKLTKQKYALKYIDKKMCVEMKAVDCIIQERFLLEEIQSPFTCNLRYAFQDDENMFMVIDLMLGGDLRYLLNTKGNLSEDLIKFYMAECVLGIAYLHSKNIVHRDLKPDNILISETGHATLTDFNIATKYNPDKLMKSEAGSPAYMAPEMFIRKGYNNMIDYWSLGVIMYELLYGKRPFEANTSEGLKKAIISDEVAWKSTRELSADCKSAITEFLQKEWNVRMGGDEKVSKHAFFKDLDWDKLKRHEGVPPFIPDTKNINCDFTHELEEILVNDNPLVAKARKPGEKKYAHLGEEIAKEYEKMEAQFLNFDFTKPEMKKHEKEQIMRSVAKLVPADEHDISADGGESPTSGETEKTAGQDGEGEKPIAHDLPPIMVTEASVIDTPNPDQ